MIAKTFSFGITGLDAYPITIETDITLGLPSFTIVGLPDNAIKESRERVRSAIKNCGFTFPAGRITVNLSPADLKKEGPGFDLAIALCILASSEQIDTQLVTSHALLGELSLDGTLLPINGTLSFAMAVDKNRFKSLIVPSQNAKEASLAQTVPVFAFEHLTQVIHFLVNPQEFKPQPPESNLTPPKRKYAHLDFSDVKGQTHIKRGLEVAAAGGHNVILIGSPGSGKTMLAKRLAGILPDMSFHEALEVTRIHSVAGLNHSTGIACERPFRSPHHTASDVALIGGGTIPRPGEVSLAHHGILFLDELPEFDRHVLEVLRQPLEDHCVIIARAARTLKFPAQFMLIAAMNPCPCGYKIGGKKPCLCSSLQVARYMGKISGPLLDRIDIHLEAHALKTIDMFNNIPSENSATIKKRATKGRNIQLERFKEEGIFANSQMFTPLIKKYCALTPEGKSLLEKAVDTLGLSARAHDKILKIARTVADLDSSDDITTTHLAEAIGYRALDRVQ